MTCTAQGWYLYLVLPFSKLESQDFPGQSLDFLPERWLDQEGALIKEPRMFIPFSEGVRHCIGWRLAMDESKVGYALRLLFTPLQELAGLHRQHGVLSEAMVSPLSLEQPCASCHTHSDG